MRAENRACQTSRLEDFVTRTASMFASAFHCKLLPVGRKLQCANLIRQFWPFQEHFKLPSISQACFCTFYCKLRLNTIISQKVHLHSPPPPFGAVYSLLVSGPTRRLLPFGNSTPAHQRSREERERKKKKKRKAPRFRLTDDQR